MKIYIQILLLFILHLQSTKLSQGKETYFHQVQRIKINNASVILFKKIVMQSFAQTCCISPRLRVCVLGLVKFPFESSSLSFTCRSTVVFCSEEHMELLS